MLDAFWDERVNEQALLLWSWSHFSLVSWWLKRVDKTDGRSEVEVEMDD